MKKILFLIPIIILTSCLSQRKCNQKYPCKANTNTITKYIRYDSLIQTPEDQGMFYALLSCDSTRAILVDSIYKIVQGKKILISTNAKQGFYLPNNIIKVNATIPKDSFYKTFYQKEVYKIIENNLRKKEVTPFQATIKLLIWLLYGFIVLVLIWVLYKILKK